VSHYAYNALVSSMVMLRSDDLYYTVSGLAVVGLMFVPAMPGAFRIARGNALLEWSTDEGEASQIPEAREPAREPRFHYIPFVPLPFSRYVWLAIFSLATFFAASLLFTDKEPFGDYVDVEVGRIEAQANATEHLDELGVSLEGYQAVTYFSNGLGGDKLDYLVEEIGIEELNDFCETYLPGDVVWITRFFKPLEKKRFVVQILPSGDPFSWRTVLREDTPGAQLSQEDAQAKAEDFLRKELPFSPDDYRLVDSNSEELEARTDHFFVWELDDGSIGAGYIRVVVPVIGDLVTEYRSYIHVPDDWTRERETTTGWDMLFFAEAMALSLLAVVFVGGIFTMLFMNHQLNWRIGLVSGVFAAACNGILSANTAPTFWAAYNPIKEPNVYRIEQILEAGLASVGAFVVAFLAAPLVEGYFRVTSPSSRPPTEWFGQTIGRFCRKMDTEYNPLPLRRVWGEALLVGGILTVGLLSVAAFIFPTNGGAIPPILQMVTGALKSASGAPDPSLPVIYTSAFPLIENMVEVLLFTGGAWLLAGAAISMYRRFIRTLPRAAVTVLSMSTLFALYGIDGVNDFIFKFGYTVATCCLLAVPIGVLYSFSRGNQATYLATVFMTGLLASGSTLTEGVTPAVAVSGWLVLALWFGLILLGIYLIRTSPRFDSVSL